MATIRCPECGYSESDGRPHDRQTYPEVCVSCTRKMCAPFVGISQRELRIADAFTPPDPFSRKV